MPSQNAHHVRASMRKPSCLISCSQAPAGGFAAGLGRQGLAEVGEGYAAQRQGV